MASCGRKTCHHQYAVERRGRQAIEQRAIVDVRGAEKRHAPSLHRALEHVRRDGADRYSVAQCRDVALSRIARLRRPDHADLADAGDYACDQPKRLGKAHPVIRGDRGRGRRGDDRVSGPIWMDAVE